MKEGLPYWIKKRYIDSDAAREASAMIKRLGLNTVCAAASCPNRFECSAQNRVTFMILGDVCTRRCAFCSVKKGSPAAVDAREPEKISLAVSGLSLRHAVVTSVTRDDLEDGGSGHFRRVVCRVKKDNPDTTVEVLTPDFSGSRESIDEVAGSPIDIFSHNIETVPRLYNTVRSGADYKRSLEVLRMAKDCGKPLKSGLMLGLGETRDEIFNVMRDLSDVGCDYLTIGQYLRPTNEQFAVREFVHPDIFESYRSKALALGFKEALSEPFARTSYGGDRFHSS